MSPTTEIARLAASLAKLADELAARDAEPKPEPVRTLPERVLLTVEEAAEQLGIGRTMAFKLIRAGEIATVQIGRLRRVPVSAVREYAAQLIHQAA